MNNSASNLLSILEACKEQPKNISCADAWRQVLCVDSNTQLIGGFAEFLSLAEAASKEVDAIHEGDAGVEYWKSRIIRGFYGSSMSEPWEKFLQQIDDVTIFTLRNHAALINLKKPARALEKDDAGSIYQALDQATELLMQLDVTDEVKSLLLTRIEQLKSLIHRYRFVSPSAVMDAAEILAAEISLAAQRQPNLKSSSFHHKVKEGLELLANATQVASATPMFISATTYFLGLVS